jgi:hypothetical protein
VKDTRNPYRSPAAFRRALEDRLKKRASERGEDLVRLRRFVAFDRFLARLFTDERPPLLVLKGGFALEVRYPTSARATKDVDLSLPDTSLLVPHPEDGILGTVIELLRQAAARDVGDYFVIFLGDARQDFDAPPDGGARYPVTTHLDGRPFARFHLDVGLGDVMIEPADWRSCEDLLDFAGIPPARIPLLPITQQIAEKLHAYTLPREGTSNSRAKDLVDLVLLIEEEKPELRKVQRAIIATFERRGTPEPPAELPMFPAGWELPYTKMAKAVRAQRESVQDAHRFVADFWNSMGF